MLARWLVGVQVRAMADTVSDDRIEGVYGGVHNANGTSIVGRALWSWLFLRVVILQV